MGDNLGPFGLSRGCNVISSRVDPTDAERIRLRRYGVTHHGSGHYGSVRASAVNPARPGAPLRASGVDGESAAKRWPSHAMNAEKRVSHQGASVVPETWVTGIGPNGLSRGCKVFCSRSKYPRS